MHDFQNKKSLTEFFNTIMDCAFDVWRRHKCEKWGMQNFYP